MTPGQLIRALRERKGLTQRRLALRAGTSQSAIARIEGGDEDVTWGRLRSILIAMGEEPELGSRPLSGRYRPEHLLQDRAMSANARLNGGLRFNEFAGQLTAAGRRAKAGDADR
jgi:transcriptional regulator with XRE-family HTH domain